MQWFKGVQLFRTTVDLKNYIGAGFGCWCHGDASAHMDILFSALIWFENSI